MAIINGNKLVYFNKSSERDMLVLNYVYDKKLNFSKVVKDLLYQAMMTNTDLTKEYAHITEIQISITDIEKK